MAMVREPVVLLDRYLRIVTASRSYAQMFPAPSPYVQERPFCEFKSLRWNHSVLELLETVLSQDAVVENHEIELDVPSIGRRHILLSARPATDQGNADVAMLVGMQDVTVSREAEALKIALKRETRDASNGSASSRRKQLADHRKHLVAEGPNREIGGNPAAPARCASSAISVATVQRQLSVTGVGNDVELGPYLKVLCEGLASSMIGDDQAVTILSSATAGAIKSEDAVSFGLIVTELVINSLKHGFPDGRSGHIVVEYVKEGAEWRLSVSDDGVGRSADPPQPLHVGLGTSIVDALARNLNARVEIALPGPGAATAIVHAGPN